MDDTPVFERFLSLAKRELSADDVRLLAQGEAPPEAPNVIVARLTGGRHVIASFATPPRDADALARRLAMLADTFAEALAFPPSERLRARPPVMSSLHEELKALGVRARACDVIVIDIDSPVVWGCASVRSRPRARTDSLLRDVSEQATSLRDAPSEPRLSTGEPVDQPLQDVTLAPTPSRVVPDESSYLVAGEGDDDDNVHEPELSRLAIASIRRLPLLGNLHKGRHLRHVEREGAYNYLVLSFSGIYLLCLIFEGEFDELRAERAAHESLPRIERLVFALPPLDPEPQPQGGVIAMRRSRSK